MSHGTRLQVFTLHKSTSRKQNYETQEAVIDTSTPETTSPVSSLHTSVSSRTSSSADTAMSQNDSGYVGTSVDQLAVEGAEQSAASL